MKRFTAKEIGHLQQQAGMQADPEVRRGLLTLIAELDARQVEEAFADREAER